MLLVLALQPVYVAALAALDFVAPTARRAAHLAAVVQEDDHIASPAIPGDWDTECVALAIGLEPGASPLQNAVAAARPVGLVKPRTVCGYLRAGIAEGGHDIYWLPYSRYWHGYRVSLDPLTAWLPVEHARYVMLIGLIASLAWLAAESEKLTGRPAARALVVSTVAFTDIWRMYNITVHAAATIVVMAGAALCPRAQPQRFDRAAYRDCCLARQCFSLQTHHGSRC
ncbi:hypothetical protein [Bradyrhizobium arachidis]|uniref:hypothetical protein n=1 Tax=Bradyrhizobium arachidis TaxID=858423 RepID=UPI002162D33B|nr:hypothetical protein [Bradyrhizobium arachidis]UVO30206.1 hypothetical protein KUF59_05435 [Bradyrhizobium arachidis]